MFEKKQKKTNKFLSDKRNRISIAIIISYIINIYKMGCSFRGLLFLPFYSPCLHFCLLSKRGWRWFSCCCWLFLDLFCLSFVARFFNMKCGWWRLTSAAAGHGRHTRNKPPLQGIGNGEIDKNIYKRYKGIYAAAVSGFTSIGIYVRYADERNQPLHTHTTPIDIYIYILYTHIHWKDQPFVCVCVWNASSPAECVPVRCGSL